MISTLTLCLLLQTPAPAAPGAVTVDIKGPRTVTVNYRGTLKDALQQVAQKGGLNLVITGDLSQNAEVMLNNISAEEALETVARVYQLEVHRERNLWVIRSAHAAPTVAAPPVKPVAPVAAANAAPPKVPAAAAKADDDSDSDSASDEERDDAEIEGLSNSSDPDDVTQAAERARDRADRLREKAEELRERARELRDAKREEAQAKADEVKARVEEAKARLEEASARGQVLSQSGPVLVKEGERVESAVSYGGPVTVERDAVVEGDVVAFGGDVVLKRDSKVEGDAVSFGGVVRKEDGAKVHGEEVSFGSRGLGSMMASRAVQVSRGHDDGEGDAPGHFVPRFLLEFAVLFGLGFVFMMFAPARMKAMENELARKPVENGLVGALGLLLSLPLTVMLCLTIIGIPVAVVLWVLAGVGMVMGLVCVANVLGSKLPVLRKRKTQAVVLALGLLALLAVLQIPVVGPVVMSVASFAAAGAVIRTRFGQRGQNLPVIETVAPSSQPVA